MSTRQVAAICALLAFKISALCVVGCDGSSGGAPPSGSLAGDGGVGPLDTGSDLAKVEAALGDGDGGADDRTDAADTGQDGTGDSGEMDGLEPTDGSDTGVGADGDREAEVGGDAGSEEGGMDAPLDVQPEPGPGERGGVCGPGDSCSSGECTALPGKYGKRCTEPCSNNYQCSGELRCEAVSPDSMFCLFGPRGAGGVGEPCGDGLKGLGCKSGLCVDADPAHAVPVDTCTDVCDSDPACQIPFPVCVGGVQLCFPIVSGDLGGLCEYDGSCYEGTCLDVPDTGERCTRMCTPGESCGEAYLECRKAGDQSYCLMRN